MRINIFIVVYNYNVKILSVRFTSSFMAMRAAWQFPWLLSRPEQLG
jgi:hypothetical protein